MKILVVFYSRTGNTKKAAQEIAKQLNAAFCKTKETKNEILIEEIFDTKTRSGARGYLSGGRDAALRKLTEIKSTAHDPGDYDIIILGTPIWSWNMAPAVRTYLSENIGSIKNIALFATMGGSGDERAFREMSEICAKTPLATMGLLAKDIINNNFSDKISQFITELSKLKDNIHA